MDRRSLKTGVAYHGNRMPSHVRADLEEIAKADMDVVVHMLSHTDWERHGKVIKDICKMTEDAGLEVWMDNWGINGVPGDKSHFLCAHPEAHMIFSNGDVNPYHVCLNHPDFRSFVHNWIETVADMNVKTIFWDEPQMPTKRIAKGSNDRYFACCCPTCKAKFEEKYGRPMPPIRDGDATEFAMDTMLDFFRDITEYSGKMGIENATCLIPKFFFENGKAQIKRLCELPYLTNLGTDPYWTGYYADGGIDPEWMADHGCLQPYEYVYGRTKGAVDFLNAQGKAHNIWIQTHDNPAGSEEEIIQATEAAYDGGARCILSWSYAAGESNNYRSARPEVAWRMTVEAMRRIRAMERDRILAENRKQFLK